MSVRPCLLAALILVPAPLFAQALPGTELWDDRGDPATAMVAGIGRYLDRELAASVERRQARWKRDFSSKEAYEASIAPNRERLRSILGATGRRVEPVVLSYIATPDSPTRIDRNLSRFTAYAVRWTVYPGVEAEGLLLEPKGEVKADVVAMADCARSPETLAGFAREVPLADQPARWLAESGCRVLVPTLIDRTDEFSGSPLVRMTNLPHREWLWRMAFECGRHPIGYEVDEVRAAVDWLTRTAESKRPVGVYGQGEGGRIALYAAALDTRIDAACVVGSFGPREKVWGEPIDRDVWGLLEEFGDAEVASLVLPRALIIQADRYPVVAGPPPARDGRADAASGRLDVPPIGGVTKEYDRLRAIIAQLKDTGPQSFVPPKATPDGFDLNEAALGPFLRCFDLRLPSDVEVVGPADARRGFDPRARMKRIVGQFVGYTQSLLRTSELRRYDAWSKADTRSPERWSETTEPYRQRLWDEVIGRFPPASEPLQAKTQLLRETANFRAYAVQLPVWPDVVASGVLLLPKDLKDGERRPVVVCQHGLEGTPDPVVDPSIKSPYNGFGAQLADRGYIVYAPQNPYIGHDAFRVLQRKAHPLKGSLFAVIVRQHERTLEWLASLPQVDPDRIAFYGLSYGGKTAMRVPALLKGYCLSICSADFNEWVVKCTNVDRSYSYLYTIEYDMYEWGLSEGFNYAEMAGLIAPRPFMVERGHEDGVAPDEWIGYEFAKVRRLYDTLGIGDRAEIAYFNGGHMIDGKGTFAFLAKHLNWPRGGD